MAKIVLTKSLQKYKIALKMTYSTCSMINTLQKGGILIVHIADDIQKQSKTIYLLYI
jgi:hypothetical protein